MGTHYRGTESEIRALDAYIKLMRSADSVSARIHRHLSRVALTPSQFGILEALHHLGPLSQLDLGKKLLRSRGNVTVVVDNLETRGLVRRKRNPRDRRFVSVGLTEEGRDLIQQIFKRHVEVIVQEMETLSPTELHEFSRLCRKLGRGERGGP
jgi:MarR family 2-MHQ and catechol resistance regulon transcriptional repressor